MAAAIPPRRSPSDYEHFLEIPSRRKLVGVGLCWGEAPADLAYIPNRPQFGEAHDLLEQAPVPPPGKLPSWVASRPLPPCWRVPSTPKTAQKPQSTPAVVHCRGHMDFSPLNLEGWVKWKKAFGSSLVFSVCRLPATMTTCKHGLEVPWPAQFPVSARRGLPRAGAQGRHRFAGAAEY